MSTSIPQRRIAPPEAVDFDTPGRRDYAVRFEHPTTWAYYLVPVTVFVGHDAAPGRGLVAIGSTHGNEYEGPIAIKTVLAELNISAVAGRIVLIPVLNASAFRAGTRDTPEDGGNLNRAFPGDAAGALTQRLAHFVSARVFPNVHLVLDLHAGGRVARFPILASFHRVPDAEQARAMEAAARGFGTPFLGYYQDATPGLLTSCAERLGKIAVGGEFGWGEAVNAEGVAMARRGILAAALRHGLWRGTLPPALCAPDRQILCDASDLGCYVLAPRGGVFEPTVACGQRVGEGQTIARLHDFDAVDAPALDLRAPHEGYIQSQAWGARVERGQVVSIVAPECAWMQESAI